MKQLQSSLLRVCGGVQMDVCVCKHACQVTWHDELVHTEGVPSFFAKRSRAAAAWTPKRCWLQHVPAVFRSKRDLEFVNLHATATSNHTLTHTHHAAQHHAAHEQLQLDLAQPGV